MIRFGLFPKLLLSSLLVLLSLMLLAWFGVHRMETGHIHDKTLSLHRSQLAEAANFTQNWLDNNRNLLEFAAETSAISSMNPALQRPVLRSLLDRIPASYLNMVIDHLGNNIARSDNQPGKDYRDRHYYTAISRHGLDYAYQLIISRTNFKPAIVMSVPIRADDGERVGVLASGISIAALQQTLNRLFNQPNRIALVLDPYFNIVARSGQRDQPLAASPQTEFERFELPRGLQATVACNQIGQLQLIHEVGNLPVFGDREAVLSYCRLDNGWRVAFIQDHQQAHEEAQALESLLAWILLIAALLAIGASLALSRLLIGRLDQLSRQVVDAANQGTAFEIDHHQSDAFARLGHTVAQALRGQQLINQLLHSSYAEKSLPDLAVKAVEILSAAPCFNNTIGLSLYLANPDHSGHYHYALSDAIRSTVKPLDQLPSSARCCLAQGETVVKPANGLIDQSQPIRFGDKTLGCLQFSSGNNWSASDQDRHFITTYLEVLASIVNQLEIGAELAQHQRITEQLIDNSGLMICVRTLDNEFILTNKLFEHCYRLTPASGERPTLEQLDPMLRHQLIRSDHEVIQQRHALNYDESFQPLEQHRRSFLTLKFPILNVRDEVVAIGSVSTDISHRLAMEQQLKQAYSELEHKVEERTGELNQSNRQLQRQKEELETLLAQLNQTQTQLLQSEKLASLGQLAAGIAHEINNPIGFVSSNINSLKRHHQLLNQLFDQLEQQLASLPASNREAILQLQQQIELDYLRSDLDELVEESLEGLDRVKKIVRDLNTFSRADRDEWEHTDLIRCLDSTVNMVRSELKQKAELIKAYQPLPPVECKPSQISQVVINLLLNAAQAITQHGRITLTTGHDEQRIWIEISDTGCGIADEDRSRVFEPFFTTKPVGEGTGLGLSVSYNIIRAHHGSLSFTSVVGQGSCFRIELPIRQPDQPFEDSTN